MSELKPAFVAKAKQIAQDLKESGIVFPIPWFEAWKFRGVGRSTLSVWEQMGLLKDVPRSPTPLEIREQRLKEDLKFYEDLAAGIRRQLETVERQKRKSFLS